MSKLPPKCSLRTRPRSRWRFRSWSPTPHSRGEVITAFFRSTARGLIGTIFVHRTSRAADPQLHTHLLLANKVRAADGAWLALDARELFEHQKAAGMLYKAALRAELTKRCDVACARGNGASGTMRLCPTLIVATRTSAGQTRRRVFRISALWRLRPGCARTRGIDQRASSARSWIALHSLAAVSQCSRRPEDLTSKRPKRSGSGSIKIAR